MLAGECYLRVLYLRYRAADFVEVSSSWSSKEAFLPRSLLPVLSLGTRLQLFSCCIRHSWQLCIQQNLLFSFISSSVSLPHHTIITYIPVFGVPATVGKVGMWHSFSGIFTVSRQWPSSFVICSKFCCGSGAISIVPSLMIASLIIPWWEFQFSTLWYA